MFIIDDILFMPLQPIMMVAEKIDEMTREEFFDKGRIKQNLMNLQLKFDLGQISEAEFMAREAELLARLGQAGE